MRRIDLEYGSSRLRNLVIPFLRFIAGTLMTCRLLTPRPGWVTVLVYRDGDGLTRRVLRSSDGQGFFDWIGTVDFDETPIVGMLQYREDDGPAETTWYSFDPPKES